MISKKAKQQNWSKRLKEALMAEEMAEPVTVDWVITCLIWPLPTGSNDTLI